VYAPSPFARFGSHLATDLRDVTSDPSALESAGWWAVVADFEGRLLCARFGDVRETAAPGTAARKGIIPAASNWRGPAPGDWTSSMDRDAYIAGVRRIRDHIAAGEVYQANLCRVLSAPLPDPSPDASDIAGLSFLLARGNPAPYAGAVRLPAHGVEVATASPELFLRRCGSTVTSGPIKGTARTADGLLEKDHAENVMIVDLVRDDLGRVCAPGTVTVPALCDVEPHPGLVHLVSTVRGELAPGAGWPDLLRHTFPPGSVTGAPKLSALRIIGELESAPRGPYCGGIGWVDADRGTGELAVGIRTFWIERDAPAPGGNTAGAGPGGGAVLRFGTGAGITWGSDPEAEWAETELKAYGLLKVASEVRHTGVPRSTATSGTSGRRAL
jgi:para-aminobenzoate synthetase component 1